MRNKFPVLTVKTLLKSVSIYGSYRKNKTGYRFLEHPVFGIFGIIVPVKPKEDTSIFPRRWFIFFGSISLFKLT